MERPNTSQSSSEVLSEMCLNTLFEYALLMPKITPIMGLLMVINVSMYYLRMPVIAIIMIDELLKDCAVLFSGTNILLILDDYAVSKDLKHRSNKFIDLAFSGRHVGLSVWVLTQQLTSIAKPFRENVACIVSFHNPSQVSTKMLFEDYGGDFRS